MISDEEWDVLLYGTKGVSKERLAQEKQQAEWYRRISNIDNVRKPATISADRIVPMTLPTKVCHYGKNKVEWYGERKLTAIKNYYGTPGTQLSMWPVVPMGATTGRNPLEGKRFIGVSEPEEHDVVDHEFLKRFTGDEWVETKTLNKKSFEWVPQGELIITSGQPLRMNNKSKELIERVQRIEFPEEV